MQLLHNDSHEVVNCLLHLLNFRAVSQFLLLLANAQNSEGHIDDSFGEFANTLSSCIRWSFFDEHYVEEILALVLKEVLLDELEENHSLLS